VITAGIILSVLLAASSPNGTDAGHKGLLKVACVECHTHLPFPGSRLELRNDVGAVCATCHPRYHGNDSMRSHPLNVTTSLKIPPDMILDTQGKIACFTCHAFHGEYRDGDGKKKFYLRRTPGKTFCFSCHKQLPGLTFKP
jgi:hypothetical protein